MTVDSKWENQIISCISEESDSRLIKKLNFEGLLRVFKLSVLQLCHLLAQHVILSLVGWLPWCHHLQQQWDGTRQLGLLC